MNTKMAPVCVSCRLPLLILFVLFLTILVTEINSWWCMNAKHICCHKFWMRSSEETKSRVSTAPGGCPCLLAKWSASTSQTHRRRRWDERASQPVKLKARLTFSSAAPVGYGPFHRTPWRLLDPVMSCLLPVVGVSVHNPARCCCLCFITGSNCSEDGFNKCAVLSK